MRKWWTHQNKKQNIEESRTQTEMQPILRQDLAVPSLESEQWQELVKNILIKYFMCYEALITNDIGEQVECLHMPFLLRKNVSVELCKLHWPTNSHFGIQQMTMEFSFYPVIPFGMLSAFLNNLREQTWQYFVSSRDPPLSAKCLWQGGAIMTVPTPEEDVRILIQAVNYSFNPDDPDIELPVNSGPYITEPELMRPTIYIMIRGPTDLKSNMWRWLIFAKESLTQLISQSWPGCHFEVFMPCPLAIGKINARDFDHGSEPFEQDEWIQDCKNCSNVQKSL